MGVHVGSLAMGGRTSFRVFRQNSESERALRTFADLYDRLERPEQVENEIAQLEHKLGLRSLLDEIRLQDRRKVIRGYFKVLMARSLSRISGVTVADGSLWMTVIPAGGMPQRLGLVSVRLVTTAGVNFLVDALQGTVEPEILRYHGIGTGTNAEATGDTALQTELTTQYSTDNTRATGSLTEGASANIFRTVGTNTVDAAVAITEHGILSQAATGGGTLLDRSVFSVINLANGDSLQSTYDLTLTAGG